MTPTTAVPLLPAPVLAALDSIEPWRGRVLACEAVPGGLSNSNWVVTLAGETRRFFLKLPGPGTEGYIDRVAANEATAAASRAGLGPELAYFDPVTGIEAIEFLEGYRASTSRDFRDLDVARAVLALYRTLHAGPPLSATKTVFDMTAEHLDHLRSIGAPLPRMLPGVLADYDAAHAAFLASGLDLVPCHNDPMPGNFLVAPDRPMRLVDFEYASNNERGYELGVFVGEMFYTENETRELLEDYYGTASEARFARVSVARAVADVKWGLWALANRAASEWDFDYQKYGIWKLERARDLMLDPRWPDWLRTL